MREKDIRVGHATVVADERGGWALPGGGRTERRLEAVAVASEVDHLISASKFNRPVPEPEPTVITRRKAKSDNLLQSRT